jgi:predicted nucleic acid-binding protein
MPDALLDTNAVSDLMDRHPVLTARAVRHPGRLLTNVIVHGEIRYGIERLPPGRKRADLEARAASVMPTLVIEPLTVPFAELYGRLRASLDAQAVNLKDNDLWIATTALALGAILVTRDRIFWRVPGLQVEDWTV